MYFAESDDLTSSWGGNSIHLLYVHSPKPAICSPRRGVDVVEVNAEVKVEMILG